MRSTNWGAHAPSQTPRPGGPPGPPPARAPAPPGRPGGPPGAPRAPPPGGRKKCKKWAPGHFPVKQRKMAFLGLFWPNILSFILEMGVQGVYPPGCTFGPPRGAPGGPPRAPPGQKSAHFFGYLITLPVGTDFGTFFGPPRDTPLGQTPLRTRGDTPLDPPYGAPTP